MRLWKFGPLLLVILLQASGCGIIHGILDWINPPKRDTTLFVLPLDGAIAAPVAAETIENYTGVCRAVLSWRSGQVATLRRIVRRAPPASFRYDSVRVKAIGLLDDEEILIDSAGGVLFIRGRKEAQLRSDDLRWLQRQIASLLKKKSCTEAQRPAPGS